MKEKCRAFFTSANKAEEVYVAKDKLFVDEGAARSYGVVVKVRRADVMETVPKGEEKELLNDKIEE